MIPRPCICRTQGTGEDQERSNTDAAPSAKPVIDGQRKGTSDERGKEEGRCVGSPELPVVGARVIGSEIPAKPPFLSIQRSAVEGGLNKACYE
jgi:hypothetical protein